MSTEESFPLNMLCWPLKCWGVSTVLLDGSLLGYNARRILCGMEGSTLSIKGVIDAIVILGRAQQGDYQYAVGAR